MLAPLFLTVPFRRTVEADGDGEERREGKEGRKGGECGGMDELNYYLCRFDWQCSHRNCG